jgi:23S rRNA pseudouridine1911/1915/1917 synthase
MSETFELEIPAALGGKRLDQAVASLLPDYSRSRIQQWIEAGQVLLNGAAASVKQKVYGGEVVLVVAQIAPAEQVHQAEAIGLDIVFEDDALLVINKPPGLVVHPGAGNWSGTLMNALLHHGPLAHELPRAGIVHRLDKDTSGLLVVAKTLPAHTALVRDLQARTVKRTYQAVALGYFDMASGTVEGGIGRHPTQRTRMALLDHGGKPSVTHWRVLRQFEQAALIECRLETGRTHQIRVHMTHLGHPLVGDAVYGPRKPPIAFPRQALHAWRLGLDHPSTGEPMQWEAPLPQDMVDLLESLS